MIFEFYGTITKEDILTDDRFKKLSLDELSKVILYKISPKDYDALEGITSVGKAKKLHELWKL